MDFGGKSGPSEKPLSNKKSKVNLSSNNDVDKLQFYAVPPTEIIGLTDFEEYAVERLKILKIVEDAGIRFIKGSKEYKAHLDKHHTSLLIMNEENKRKDHISHFILRLAYCRSEDLKRWLIAQEMDLFRYRFENEFQTAITKFLEENDLHYYPISKAEKLSIIKQLVDSCYEKTVIQVEEIDYFKVPFAEAVELVKSRKVYLCKGEAYVPRNDLVSIILGHFRSNLSHALTVTARALPNLEEDDRILPLVYGLSKAYLGQDYSSKGTSGEVTADKVDELSKCFPLCMSQCHTAFRQQNHLKHGARLQYGLFLKGIGLSLEEAMKFFRQGFTKSMDVDTFDKKYSYNIRYNYGKEGKRANYTPYSCMKVVSSTPGAGDCHGCPFRHMDHDLLKQKIASNPKINSNQLNLIMKSAKENHYGVACSRYLEGIHGLPDGSVRINHPNEYFDEYLACLKGLRKEAPVVPVEKVRLSQVTKSQSSQSSSQFTQGSTQRTQPTQDDDFTDDGEDSLYSQIPI